MIFRKKVTHKEFQLQVDTAEEDVVVSLLNIKNDETAQVRFDNVGNKLRVTLRNAMPGLIQYDIDPVTGKIEQVQK